MLAALFRIPILLGLEIVRAIFLFVWQYVLGWRITGPIPDIDRVIVIAVPHTSNWDYLHYLAVGLHARRRPFVTVKKSLTKPPLGWFIVAVGGIPVDRSKSNNLVHEVSARIKAAPRMMMVFTPEGTRSYRPHWRTGFYYTAVEAGVPIACATINYKTKRVGVGLLVHPTGDIRADFEPIRAYYEEFGQNGHTPSKMNGLRLPPYLENEPEAGETGEENVAEELS